MALGERPKRRGRLSPAAAGFTHPWPERCIPSSGFLVTDIGQHHVEEVNLGIKGANYGWPLREGTFVTDRHDPMTLHGLPPDDAAFGFTSAWRVFISDRRGEGLRAQMAMLAIAVLLFFPALSAGQLFGQPVQGNVSPIGVSLLFGAFVFGIGMQIGGGCASGTLYTVGGGSVRMNGFDSEGSWEFKGGKLIFDCNNFTGYEVEVTGDKMSGIWKRLRGDDFGLTSGTSLTKIRG